MNTIGILGSFELLTDVEALGPEVNVIWGTDSSIDALKKMSGGDPADLLVVEASVAYLTFQIIENANRFRMVALTLDEASKGWVSAISGMEMISSFSDLKRLPGINTQVNGSARPGVVAVWGPVGAPGATTVAISLAAVAAKAGLRVLLCDVDTRGSTIAVALGLLDETPGFAAACRLAGRGELTESELRRLAVHAGNSEASFEVLTGLPRSSRWAEVAPEKCRKVVTLAKEMFDLIVVDTGFGIEENEWIDEAPQRDGTAREILRSAEKVLAVGAADVVGLTRFIRALDEVSVLTENPVVILNKLQRGDGGEVREAIERFTSHTVQMTIPHDSRKGLEEAFSRALDSGKAFQRLLNQVGVAVPMFKRRHIPWR